MISAARFVICYLGWEIMTRHILWEIVSYTRACGAGSTPSWLIRWVSFVRESRLPFLPWIWRLMFSTPRHGVRGCVSLRYGWYWS